MKHQHSRPPQPGAKSTILLALTALCLGTTPPAVATDAQARELNKPKAPSKAIAAKDDVSAARPPDKEFVFKKTPQAELKIFMYFPKDWKPEDKRPAMLLFHGGSCF